MTSGSAQRKPLPGGYHLLLSYYLAVRLRVSPRDFHPHLSIFLEKDEPWMSRTSKPNNFVAWSQPVGFPLLLIIRFVKSAETKKRGHDLGLHPYECNCRPYLTIWLFNVSLLFLSITGLAKSADVLTFRSHIKRREPRSGLSSILNVIL